MGVDRLENGWDNPSRIPVAFECRAEAVFEFGQLDGRQLAFERSFPGRIQLHSGDRARNPLGPWHAEIIDDYPQRLLRRIEEVLTGSPCTGPARRTQRPSDRNPSIAARTARQAQHRTGRKPPTPIAFPPEATPWPELRTAVSTPPFHLQPGIGYRPSVTDDVDKSRLRENLAEEAEPGPTSILMQEVHSPLRSGARFEEIFELCPQPRRNVVREQVPARILVNWRDFPRDKPKCLGRGEP